MFSENSPELSSQVKSWKEKAHNASILTYELGKLSNCFTLLPHLQITHLLLEGVGHHSY